MYVPLTLPGELVRAAVTGKRGEAIEIVEPSPERVGAPCPHFGACGGCALQHWRSEAVLAWKTGELTRALARAGYDRPPLGVPVQTPPGSRRRLDLALRREHGRVLVGLHRMGEGAVVDLATCLVAHPALVALIAPLRALLGAGGLLRREGAAVVNLLDAGADLLLRTDAEPDVADRAGLVQFGRAHGLARVSWARGSDAPEPVCVLKPPTIAFGGVTVSPPPGAFLQASPAGERGIAEAVREGLVMGRRRIAELYAGCGTLTFPLAAAGWWVEAFEGDPAAHAALREAANWAGLGGRIGAHRRDLARQPLAPAELARVDAVVLDPPHAGAPAQMPALAAAGPARIVYVSCNPAALARDAAVLRAAGYRLEAATLIDQFLHSARIEAVCTFARARRGRARI